MVASFSQLRAKDIGNILNNAHIHNWGKEGAIYKGRVLIKIYVCLSFTHYPKDKCEFVSG